MCPSTANRPGRRTGNTQSEAGAPVQEQSHSPGGEVLGYQVTAGRAGEWSGGESPCLLPRNRGPRPPGSCPAAHSSPARSCSHMSHSPHSLSSHGRHSCHSHNLHSHSPPRCQEETQELREADALLLGGPCVPALGVLTPRRKATSLLLLQLSTAESPVALGRLKNLVKFSCHLSS